jgi:hypothetical protein
VKRIPGYEGCWLPEEFQFHRSSQPIHPVLQLKFKRHLKASKNAHGAASHCLEAFFGVGKISIQDAGRNPTVSLDILLLH